VRRLLGDKLESREETRSLISTTEYGGGGHG
jgi:hypothetical protein